MDFYSRLFVLSRFPKATGMALSITIFATALLVAALTGAAQVEAMMKSQAESQIQSFEKSAHDLARATYALEEHQDFRPCSPQFLGWLRRVAFIPDGIHEFIYQGENVICSSSQGILWDGLDIGNPDIVKTTPQMSLWLDRDLKEIGFPGLRGTYVEKGAFLFIVPPLKLEAGLSSWINYQVLTPGNWDHWWHRMGEEGLFDRFRSERPLPYGFIPQHGAFYTFACDTSGFACIVLEAPLAMTIAAHPLHAGGALVLALTLAGWLSQLMLGKLTRFWSLPVRFQRTVSVKNIVCHYQPLLSLKTGRIAGVEVLARWRDIDGRLIYPDKFLPVVEGQKMTRAFTEMVVSRAYRDLSTLPAGNGPMQINFNIFPRDFDADWILAIFAPFLKMRERFDVVVELVETDALPVDDTRDIIAFLRSHGIRTYIDDFGVGYSSIHYLAGLHADGVKLDRSFAMAPADSLSATMLMSAIEMVHMTSQTMVVEGVETESRLRSLKATNKVHLVQGYHICPPVNFEALTDFLKRFDAHANDGEDAGENRLLVAR